MALLAAVSFPSSGPWPDLSARISRQDTELSNPTQVFVDAREFGPESYHAETVAVDETESLMRQATSVGAAGATARAAGEENKAEACFRQACSLAVEAANRLHGGESATTRQEILHQGVRYALECGEVKEARRLLDLAGPTRGSVADDDEWRQFHEASAWSDIWLIAAVRRDPPDEKALDVLADRYWKPLFGRCLVLTLNHHKANDLAQEAWCRVLRARHSLNPGGNFPAYLTTIATNIWRDWHRSARRAGPMAEHQLASLDAVLEAGDGNLASLADILPDLNALEAEQRQRLMMDIDQALERLAPQMRDVLVARFISHESCAEIGRRYGRTEQSVSGWIRQAVREMKAFLVESGSGPLRKEPS